MFSAEKKRGTNFADLHNLSYNQDGIESDTFVGLEGHKEFPTIQDSDTWWKKKKKQQVTIPVTTEWFSQSNALIKADARHFVKTLKNPKKIFNDPIPFRESFSITDIRSNSILKVPLSKNETLFFHQMMSFENQYPTTYLQAVQYRRKFFQRKLLVDIGGLYVPSEQSQLDSEGRVKNPLGFILGAKYLILPFFSFGASSMFMFSSLPYPFKTNFITEIKLPKSVLASLLLDSDQKTFSLIMEKNFEVKTFKELLLTDGEKKNTENNNDNNEIILSRILKPSSLRFTISNTNISAQPSASIQVRNNISNSVSLVTTGSYSIQNRMFNETQFDIGICPLYKLTQMSEIGTGININHSGIHYSFTFQHDKHSIQIPLFISDDLNIKELLLSVAVPVALFSFAKYLVYNPLKKYWEKRYLFN